MKVQKLILSTLCLFIFAATLLIAPGTALAKKKKKAAAVPTSSGLASGVAVEGLYLTEGGKPFPLTGVEKQGLLHMAPEQVKDFFAKVKQSGASAVKTNAFSLASGPDGLVVAGSKELNETALVKLDNLVALAKAQGLKLVLDLAYDQSAEGGKAQYAAWVGSANPNVFFYDYKCKDFYQSFANAVLSRKNTVTKIPYSMEPAILAWNLMDSPVNQGDEGDQVNRWISTMSSYLKKLAPRQLVSLTLWAQAPGVKAAEAEGQAGVDLVFFRLVPGRNTPWPTQAAQQAGKPVVGLAPASVLAKWSQSTAGGMATLSDFLEQPSEIQGLQTAFAALAPPAEALPGGLFNKVTVESAGPPVLRQEATMNVKILLSRPAKVSARYGDKGLLNLETIPTSQASAAQELVLAHLRAGESYACQVKAVDETGKAVLSDRISFTTPDVAHVLAKPVKRSNNFITVKGTDFYDGEKVFRYVGSNCYYLQYSPPATTETVFSWAEKLGLRVMRVGTFGEMDASTPAGEKYKYLVTGPGQYIEENWKHLDRVIASAGKHNLRIIFTLTDNWNYFGGAGMWAKYFGFKEKNDFFDKPEVKKGFKDHMTYVANRVNTVTGVKYKDDPTIFAWDLMNEPRYERDTTGQVLAAWVNEMALYLKSLGIRQLVTTGSEGARAEGGSHYSGSDFILVHQSPSIDFAAYHIYPASDNSHWNWPTTKSIIESYVKDCHALLKKPVVMEEYGIGRAQPKYDRPIWVYDMASAFYGAGGNGSNYWMLTEPGYKGDGNEFDPTDVDICNVFALQANALMEGK